MNKFDYRSGVGHGTPCPLQTNGTEIASLVCYKCDHFVAVNQMTKVVVCDAELKCTQCGSTYKSIENLVDCTKKCTCEHNWEYSLYSLEDDEVELERRCSKCDKFEELTLTFDCLTPEMIETMWKVHG